MGKEPIWLSLGKKVNELYGVGKILTKDELSEIYGQKVATQTFKAMLNHQLLQQNEDETLTVLEYDFVEHKTSGDGDSKEVNQYRGRYFEEAVTAIINKEPILNNTGYEFTEDELGVMNKNAQDLVNRMFSKAKTAEYVGRKTSKANCDVIIDGEEIELKYCKGNNGTYANYSMEYYPEEFGVTPFKEYLIKYGVLEYLEQFFGKSVYDGLSPVSDAKVASKWSKANPEENKELHRIEAFARKAFVKDVYEYLNQDPNNWRKVSNEMLNKTHSGKQPPDRIVIYRHDTHKIVEFTKEEIQSFEADHAKLNNSYTYHFGCFHITMSWQNGIGLNNPTIRVFLDGKE